MTVLQSKQIKTISLNKILPSTTTLLDTKPIKPIQNILIQDKEFILARM